MKIRSGFVSNSSSSSFVVKAVKAKFKELKDGRQVFVKWIPRLTKTQINKLKEFGFLRTWAHTPSQVPCTRKERDEHEADIAKNPNTDYSWGYDVTCNQDEVYQFLLENEISFIAEEHYGHSHVFYDSKVDRVTVAQNFGVMMAMYGVRNLTDISKGIETFTRKQYLKKVSW